MSFGTLMDVPSEARFADLVDLTSDKCIRVIS